MHYHPELRKYPFQVCGSNPSFTFSFTLQVSLLWQEFEELSEQFPATSLDPFKGDVVLHID